jgi:hypothetical protein
MHINYSKIAATIAFMYVILLFGFAFVRYFAPNNPEKIENIFSLSWYWVDCLVSTLIGWGILKQYDWIWWLSLFWSLYELTFHVLTALLWTSRGGLPPTALLIAPIL